MRLKDILKTYMGSAPKPGGTDKYELRVKNERAHQRSAVKNTAAGAGSTEQVPVKVPAYEWAMELYVPYIKSSMPNFALDELVLARQAASSRSLHLLSLGCGVGDWELRVARSSGGRLRLTLADITPELMEQAGNIARRDGLSVKTEVCDVNRIRIPEATFDFILCRSSLHHFQELEHVLDQAGAGLAPGGQFLVLGEWIGRNGVRYYPETEDLVQSIFRSLPERLRFNHYTRKTDARIPKIDFSQDTFEAVRSEEILPLLLSRLMPVEYAVLDAFLSPLFDFRYGPNYDLESELDRGLITALTRLDIEMVRGGLLKPTALHGIFAPRTGA